MRFIGGQLLADRLYENCVIRRNAEACKIESNIKYLRDITEINLSTLCF